MNSVEAGRRERLWLAAYFGFVLILAGFTVYLFWRFAALNEQSLGSWFEARPNPPITDFFHHNRVGFLLLPVPWLLFASYALWRGSASARQLIAFSSTLVFALLTAFTFATMALALPWFPGQWLMMNGRFCLDPEQLAQALYAAERNDAQANYRLYEHYALTTRQTDLADHYLRIAASLGHARAKERLRSREENSRSRK